MYFKGKCSLLTQDAEMTDTHMNLDSYLLPYTKINLIGWNVRANCIKVPQ